MIIPEVNGSEGPGPGRPERREYGRIRLDQPLPAFFGPDEVRLLEMSVVGFRIAHQGALAAETTRPLVVHWEGQRMEFVCSTIRSALVRLAKRPTEKSIYHSGLKIVECSPEAQRLLRSIISDAVVRALDEQKANARGVPPLAAYMNQSYTATLYRRCELVDGVWRKSETAQTAQPPNGFTVAADVAPEEVEMLCKTWETSNEEGRRLLRQLAELSISTTEGIPTRRYIP